MAYTGQVLPVSAGGSTIYSLSSDPILADDAGRLAFLASLAPAAAPSVLFQEYAAGLGRFAVEGEGASYQDYTFDIVTGAPFSPHAISGNGKVMFRSRIESPTMDTLTALYLEAGGLLSPAVLSSSPAPGVAGGTFTTSLEYPIVNNAGQIAFEAFMVGTGIVDSNREGIWYGTPNALQLIARDGSQAPGLPAGVNFSDTLGEIEPEPAINANGKVLFQHGLTGTGITTANDIGFWAGTPGNLSVVVREGDPLPSVGAGANINFLFNRPRTINAAGQVMFMATFTTPSGPGIGLFATDAAGVVKLVARSGQTIQVAPGDVRTIETFSIESNVTGNQDGRRTTFNDQGLLAFVATFTDDTQAVVVSDAAASPYRAGDFQEDNDVDVGDLGRWKMNAGLAAGATHLQGNGDYDGDVDGNDFLIWQRELGSGPLAGVNGRPCQSPRR